MAVTERDLRAALKRSMNDNQGDIRRNVEFRDPKKLAEKALKTALSYVAISVISDGYPHYNPKSKSTHEKAKKAYLREVEAVKHSFRRSVHDLCSPVDPIMAAEKAFGDVRLIVAKYFPTCRLNKEILDYGLELMKGIIDEG